MIASMVGKPLYADKPTKNFDRVPYARICVDIDLPESFSLCGEEVNEFFVENHMLPPCDKCKAFGHNMKN